MEPLDPGRRLTRRLSSLLTEKEDEDVASGVSTSVSAAGVREENSFLSSLLTSNSEEEDTEDIVAVSSSENIDIIDGGVV